MTLVLAALVGCAHKKAPENKETNSKAPAAPSSSVSSAASDDSFRLRPYREVTLENGLKIFYIQDDSLPRLSLNLLLKVGTVQEPSDASGLNAITAYLLEQGTNHRSATEVADDFGQLGSSLEITPGSDFTTVTADALSISSTTLLDLFSDVVMNPAFKDPEINRLRSQILAGLQKKIDDPSAYATDQLSAYVFGAHPYARDVDGTPAGIKSIRKQAIIRHYLAYYRPNNSMLAVAGNFGPDFEKKVEAIFGKWTQRRAPAIKEEAVPESKSLQVRLIEKRGLQQTQIRIGEVGIARNDPDYLNLRLANEILGGSFSSRLNQKVRDDLGLTYSIESSFEPHAEPGLFEISTFTKNPTTGQTLDQTLAVVNEYVKNGATDKELAAAKNQLMGQFPRAIETADMLAFNLMYLDFHKVPVSYLTDFNKNVQNVTLNQVNEATRKHIDPSILKVLIYSDKSVAPQLESYHPEVVKLNQ